MFVKNNIEPKRHKDLEDIFSPSLFCTFVCPNKISFNLGVVYKSPNLEKDSEQNFIQLKNYSTKKLKDLTILGDFNFP